MPKAKIILEPIKKNNYKSLYLNSFDKKYLINNDKNIKITDIKCITFINDFSISQYITFT